MVPNVSLSMIVSLLFVVQFVGQVFAHALDDGGQFRHAVQRTRPVGPDMPMAPAS